MWASKSAAVLDPLRAMRRPDESYCDLIVRLAGAARGPRACPETLVASRSCEAHARAKSG